MMTQLSNGSITHIGLIVKDIEATRQHYIRLFGAPEAGIGLVDPPAVAKTMYLGKPSGAGAKLCHLQVGPIQVELIQPLGGPSTWKDFLDQHGQGVHHIAIVTNDHQADLKLLQGESCPLIQKGEWAGGNYTYSDTQSKLGTILEIIEND
jgi:hypothetical protein